MVLTKDRDDLMCTGRVRRTRSTSVTRRVTNVKNSMMSHKRIIIVISYYELINVLFLFYLKPNFKDYIFAMSNQMSVYTLTNMVQELLCTIFSKYRWVKDILVHLSLLKIIHMGVARIINIGVRFNGNKQMT